jgi:hypothetical protein
MQLLFLVLELKLIGARKRMIKKIIIIFLLLIFFEIISGIILFSISSNQIAINEIVKLTLISLSFFIGINVLAYFILLIQKTKEIEYIRIFFLCGSSILLIPVFIRCFKDFYAMIPLMILISIIAACICIGVWNR